MAGAGVKRWRSDAQPRTSSLYTSRHLNPSTSGSRTVEEKAEATKWANQHLNQGGFSNQLITDLKLDIADGITFLRLVQCLTKEPLPRHFTNPLMRVQKLENLQMCFKFLEQHGLLLSWVHAEDVVSGNLKVILALCHSLRLHFEGSSPKLGSHGNLSHMPASRIPTSKSVRPSKLSYTSLERDDMELLAWVGNTIHRKILDYSSLYDGRALCDLVNSAYDEAVHQQLIASSSAVERLQLAFSAAEKVMGITKGSINVENLANGHEDQKMKSYLKHFRVLYQQLETKKHMKDTTVGRGSRPEEPQRAHQPAPSWEETFESLRGSSRNRTMPGASGESVVASRSYEGIMQKRASSTAELPSYVDTEEPKRHPTTSMYHSSENILSSSMPPPQQWQRRTAPVSHKQDNMQHQVELRSQQPSSRTRPRPHSEVDFGSFAGGSAPSLPSYHKQPGETQHRRALMYQPLQQLQHYHHSHHRHSHQDLSHPSIPVEMEPKQASVSSSHFVSHSSAEKTHAPDLPASLSYDGGSESQPPPLPKTAPPLSMPREESNSTLVSAQVQAQSSLHKEAPKKLVQPDGEETTLLELVANMEELDTKVMQLALLVSKERQELCRRLQSALAQERRRREEVENKHKQMVKRANTLMQHYDSCLVQMAKDVACVKTNYQKTQHQLGAVEILQDQMRSVTMELQGLQQRVNTVEKQQSDHQHPKREEVRRGSKSTASTGSTSSSSASEKGRKPLFSRKKSEKSL